MPTIIRENLRPARSGYKFGLVQRCTDVVPLAMTRGRVFIEMRDARTGDVEERYWLDDLKESDV